MIARSDIVAAARSFLGVPFQHQGRLKTAGIDCIGLIAGVGDVLGIPFDDVQGYPASPDGKTLVKLFDGTLKPLPDLEYHVGDTLVFWITHRRFPMHAGIVTDRGIIHTHAGVGRVVEHRLDERWAKRIVKAYEAPGVEPWRQ